MQLTPTYKGAVQDLSTILDFEGCSVEEVALAVQEEVCNVLGKRDEWELDTEFEDGPGRASRYEYAMVVLKTYVLEYIVSKSIDFACDQCSRE